MYIWQYHQHHQDHRIINDLKLKDFHVNGKDVLEDHVFFVMLANALTLHVLGPPDPLLVQERPQLYLEHCTIMYS